MQRILGLCGAGTALICLLAYSGQAGTTTDIPFRASGACESGESWNFGSEVEKAWLEKFESFLSGKSSAVHGFSEGMALRRRADLPEAKLFAEYWISRALLKSKLIHIAHRGFTVIASRPVAPGTLGIQSAALDCLTVIQSQSPALGISDEVALRLPEYTAALKSSRLASSGWKATTRWIQELINRGRAPDEVATSLKLLEGSGAYFDYSKGIYSAYARKNSDTIAAFKAFLSSDRSLPKDLEKYSDTAKMLLGRAYFGSEHFLEAINTLKGVSRKSNELAHSLVTLSWAYLSNEMQREAIGTAINLQSGGLRKTFSPEADMVLAMALNELCRYPESIQAIDLFKKNYGEAYQWLRAWKDGKLPSARTLYQEAIFFLKDTPEENSVKLPFKVASEWMRSPLFISRQEELNLLFEEVQSAGKLSKAGADEQFKIATELLKFAKEFKKRFDLAIVRQKPDQPLPADILKDLGILREKVAIYRHFRQAAPLWHLVLANHESRVPSLKTQLVKSINADLKRISLRMLYQLEEIAENNHFIDVEIYNGASQDIIWQNAHPDYKKVVKTLKDEETRQIASKVWNWGQVTSGFSGNGEIWEDELGSFKANLYDNCNSKDRYLALIREKMKN